MPAVGESATDCLERFPGGDFASSVDLTPYTLPDGTSGTNVLCQADKYGSLLAADVPESAAAHSHVTEVHSSHSVAVSHPDVVADVIEKAARATAK
jgi:hypothetical protein